jgi:hypothetical protein
MNTRVVVISYLIFLVAITYVLANESTKKPELFSFEKLAAYSSLASCFAKIHEDFAYCNKKAEEKGKAYLEGVDENSDWAKRVKCCGTWKLRDCWVKAAKDKCDSMQVEQIHNLPYTFMPGLEKTCKEYPPGSSKCSFPVWLIVVIVLIGVSLLALGIFCGIYFYRKRKSERIRRQLSSIPETEKMKAQHV